MFRRGWTRRHVLAASFASLVSRTAFGQAAARTVTRIAFGSCFDQRMAQPIWEAIFAYRPELFLFLGDNVYGSAPRALLQPDLPVLVNAYAMARTNPAFARIRRESEVLAVWDDHDFGLNDGGADMPYRQRAKALFLDFFDIAPDDERRTRDGLYFARSFGPEGRRLQIILLDTRWFRSPLVAPEVRPRYGRYVPTEDRSTTILGEAQWAWLAERLREPAQVRLVASSIQVVADGHNWERWGNFPHERQRLYDLVRDTGARGVVFLSGDRHLGAIYRETADVAYPMIDLTGSPASRPASNNREPGPNRLGAIYGMENFGTVDIDWWDRSLTLSVRGMNGEPARRLAVRFDELAPR
jgi:alkaline phosphatase D